MTTRRVLLVVISAAMLAWSPSARAVDLTFRVEISYNINPDGTGKLIANPAPYGQGSISWAACPPGGVCSPIAPSDPRSDRVLDVGDAAVGTVFVATAVNGSQVASARSAPYLGPVRSIAPPQIKGELRVGALVQPLPGSWSGGWGSESSQLQMQVCRTPDGANCVVIADEVYWDHCPGAGAVLTPAHLGQYVRVVDERIGKSTAVVPDFGRVVGAPLGTVEPGPRAAVAVAGPIAPATGPPESNCGQPPRRPSVVLAAHPAREHGRLVLGRITCLDDCSVYVRVRQGKRRARFVRSFPGRFASWRLWLPARLADRLKPGQATVILRDLYPGRARQTIASRRVTLPEF